MHWHIITQSAMCHQHHAFYYIEISNISKICSYQYEAMQKESYKLFIFLIFNIVPEKLFHKSDGVHTKLDMRLYLCNAFTYRAKSGTLSSQAWPEGTCTVSGKCHLLVKKCDQILLIPFYITLPKRTSIMLQPIQLCWWAWLDYIIAPCMFPKITITGSAAI